MNPVGMDQELVLRGFIKKLLSSKRWQVLRFRLSEGTMKLKMQGREISFKAVPPTPSDK